MRFDEKLDISDMVKCAENYESSLAYALAIEAKKPDTTGDNGNDDLFQYRFVRSAVIHVFEITIESAWKMMQRWVKINVDKNITQKPKRELFRTARDSGLIADAESWWEFFDGRNKTSHTYREETAEEVYALAKAFRDHLIDFMQRLEERR